MINKDSGKCCVGNGHSRNVSSGLQDLWSGAQSAMYCYLFKKTTMLALEIPDFEEGMVILTAGSDPRALIPD
jgi:DUF1680 family protein